MKINPILIGKKKIGQGYPPYIIAEIGSNFDGSLSKAKKLIRLAKLSGADAAKFQSFQTEKILSKKGFEKKSTFQKKWKKPIWDVYKNAELPIEWLKELNKYSRKIGIDFLSAPYHVEAIDELCRLGTPAIKIGSGEITNLDFLHYAAKTNKPLLLATGASTLDEVSQAVKTIRSTGNKKIILMQTVTQYPSPIKQANLNVLSKFQEKFCLNVGYSDHSSGDLVILASIVLGSCVIEKHFTDDPSLKGPDHLHSMNPSSFKEMVRKIRLIESAMGNGIKKIELCEKETRVIQRRGIWTTKKILKGEKFTRNNIEALRPCLGIPASKYINLLKKKSSRILQPYSAITNKDYL